MVLVSEAIFTSGPSEWVVHQWLLYPGGWRLWVALITHTTDSCRLRAGPGLTPPHSYTPTHSPPLPTHPYTPLLSLTPLHSPHYALEITKGPVIDYEERELWNGLKVVLICCALPRDRVKHIVPSPPLFKGMETPPPPPPEAWLNFRGPALNVLTACCAPLSAWLKLVPPALFLGLRLHIPPSCFVAPLPVINDRSLKSLPQQSLCITAMLRVRLNSALYLTLVLCLRHCTHRNQLHACYRLPRPTDQSACR